MTENESLRRAFWVLFYGIGLVFIIALVTDAMKEPYNGGLPRTLGLIIIGVLALVWVWLSKLGQKTLREMA